MDCLKLFGPYVDSTTGQCTDFLPIEDSLKNARIMTALSIILMIGGTLAIVFTCGGLGVGLGLTFAAIGASLYKYTEGMKMRLEVEHAVAASLNASKVSNQE
ncbi:MAG: hypothetical protein S4CHLAM45_06000 [Chlamydiales bacterium]|nr:hypothetical protein [Chlamydiales bacterium]MCH9619859.1 hypothetical protein [Chlamydiales bacterium]MCH9622714.1 hypothetical protein [Chlamydiales bacterium]